MLPESIHLALAQTWQIALLFGLVWIVCQTVARRRSHLAHLLWLVVILKCLIPPLWSSHFGIFCWAQTVSQSNDTTEEVTVQHSNAETTIAANRAPASLDRQDIAPHTSSRAVHNDMRRIDAEPVTAAFGAKPRGDGFGRGWPLLILSWMATTLVIIASSFVRAFWCLRKVMHERCEVDHELESLLGKLRQQLRVQRSVRLVVTRASIGPAVIGILRPVVLLPELILQGRTAKDLEPILAHEMLHIRRGDLWIGMLQVAAQAIWWFNPLVWFASRAISREAERSCDEEAIASLNCSPARYARCLLSVLERKRSLRSVPFVPGVRAVDITSKRLERIMTLEHGCHKRTPWWCWASMIAVSAITLPGAVLVMASDQSPLEPEHEIAATLASSVDDTSAPVSVPKNGVAVDPPHDVDADADADVESTKVGQRVLRRAGVDSDAHVTATVSPHENDARMAAWERRVPWSSSLEDCITISLQNAKAVRSIASVRPFREGKSESVGLTNGRRSIVLARINKDLSIIDFEAAIRDHVVKVERAYWDLSSFYGALDDAKVGRDAARQTWKRVFIEESAMDEQEVQAREQYYFFRGRLEESKRDTIAAEKRLRHLMGVAPTDDRFIDPTDIPKTTKIELDRDEVLAKAISSSPEVNCQKLQIEQTRQEIDELRDRLWSSLDDDAIDNWLGTGDVLPEARQEPSVEKIHPSIGGRMPIEFRRNLTKLRRKQRELVRQQARLQDIRLEVSHSMADSVQRLDSSYALMQTSLLQRRAAEGHVETLQYKAKIGCVTLDLLLDAQRRAADAERAFRQSVTQYGMSIVEVRWRAGSLLTSHRIVVQ